MKRNFVKNQHYVPRAYLRRFSLKVKKTHRFNVFDKFVKKPRASQSIDKYASEKGFYDINFEEISNLLQEEGIELTEEVKKNLQGLDNQIIEKELSRECEGKWFASVVKIIERFESTKSDEFFMKTIINEEEKISCTQYITTQMIRTKEFRETLKEIYVKTTKKMIELNYLCRNKIEVTDEIEIDFRNELVNIYHGKYLFDQEIFQKIAEDIYDKIWIIAVNNSDTEFITSDNPVARIFFSKGRFNSKVLEYVFPITPKLAIIMMDSKERYMWRVIENKFYNVDKERVNSLNRIQIKDSYRYVFSQNLDLNFIEQLIKNNPEIGDTNKNRVEIY